MPASKGTRPPNAGKGRPKGARNKVTKNLREMVLGALDDVGGQDYLAEQAQTNPVAFMALLGKVLPPEPRSEPIPPVITLRLGDRDIRPPEMKDVTPETELLPLPVLDREESAPNTSSSGLVNCADASQLLVGSQHEGQRTAPTLPCRAAGEPGPGDFPDL